MNYIKGDLLETDIPVIAHCVSSDYKMGAGIALKIANKYGRDNIEKGHLCSFGIKECECGKTIIYLETKRFYHQKPTYDTLKVSIIAMRDYLLRNGIRHIAIPRIGCGLDRLEWNEVKEIVQKKLVQYGIRVTVYTQ